MAWICGIYKNRPEQCKKYPLPDSYIPPSCGFFFAGDGVRRGKCLPECDASCCKLPRDNGEPTAYGLSELAGGEPCKYLIEVPDEEAKKLVGIEVEVEMEGSPKDQPHDIRELL